MYHNNIDLIATFLGLFLITNVFGATGASNLAKNQTSTNKEATQRSIESIDIRNFLTGDQIDELIEEMPSDHPHGELDFFCVCMDFVLNFKLSSMVS